MFEEEAEDKAFLEGRAFERSQTAVQNPEFNDFKKQLTSLINRYGYDSACETPDYILAEYLEKCLVNFSAAMTMNINWHTDWKRLGEDNDKV